MSLDHVLPENVRPPDMLTALLATLVVALMAWHYAHRRRLAPADVELRRRRFLLAWEVRGLVLAVAGPYAAGIFLGHVSPDYTTPLLLFVAAGLLYAQTIAPAGLVDARWR